MLQYSIGIHYFSIFFNVTCRQMLKKLRKVDIAACVIQRRQRPLYPKVVCGAVGPGLG